ncbi:carboxylating nicotinate-nucleotide diphosphorylase [Fulvivirga lutimaris]|uniref:carboxylating nicotinate-nucleotide diphosphorylase n=1 Tax=Fulvivirga lutimaris TaxID=1819566 RepID=UPI0012BC6CAD|nr:carboxylating nicotinate-nucleotide diphosphorylase [Fulvivirga lutimaris]MTI38770.1 carboxylating nicotinate-nucleotide diphosphorylase [Fulvivirga lutimaris]
MALEYLTKKALDQFIKAAIKEDVGDGDHSALACIPENQESKAQLLIKDEGILAGVDMAKNIFSTYDPNLKIETFMKDGDTMQKGDVAFKVYGSARSILTSERLVLNCMQRMSGIATYTDYLMTLISGSKAQLLDTRKTTPNFRIAEKWAVSIGGGTNHRFGLYDMVMLKDNHIDYAGSIAKAIKATKTYLKKNNKELKIEVETRNLDEVRQVIDAGGIDVIMLDNMMPSVMKEAVAMIKGQYKTEASGGITEKNIREVAECGIDFISVGALTHSVKSKDMSLKAF